jgi:hypothetical protein
MSVDSSVGITEIIMMNIFGFLKLIFYLTVAVDGVGVRTGRLIVAVFLVLVVGRVDGGFQGVVHVLGGG